MSVARRGGPLVAGVLLAAVVAGCEPPTSPPPAPWPPVSSPSPAGPQDLMSGIGQTITRAGLGDDVRQGEIETGATSYQPCDLLVSEPTRAQGGPVELDTEWAAGIEVDPVASFQTVRGPRTVLDVRVFALPDDAAAEAAAAEVRAARCPSGDFGLTIADVTARRDSRTVAIGATRARLTTATVKRINPEIEAALDYLPGEARLAFAHGPLLISIEALALRSRKANSAADITAAAVERAKAVATAIVADLPAPGGD